MIRTVGKIFLKLVSIYNFPLKTCLFFLFYVYSTGRTRFSFYCRYSARFSQVDDVILKLDLILNVGMCCQLTTQLGVSIGKPRLAVIFKEKTCSLVMTLNGIRW